MHYFLYPTKDTTITNHPDLLTKNMGLDEILEVEKTIQDVSCNGGRGAALSRTLIQFDVTDISSSFAAGDIADPRFYLSLKVAESVEVPTSYNIAAYPLAQAWDMGTGYKYDGASTSDGASWKYSDSGSIKWFTPGDSSSYSTNCDGGGLWYVSASLLGSGSGYAEPPFVSPAPYNPFPDCIPIETASFAAVKAAGAWVNSSNSASLSVEVYSGSTVRYSAAVFSGSGVAITDTNVLTASLYADDVLVSSQFSDGIRNSLTGSYNCDTGSLPVTLNLVLRGSTTDFYKSVLILDGCTGSFVGACIASDNQTSSLSSTLGDAIVEGYFPVTPFPTTGWSEVIPLAGRFYTTSYVGGTDIYSKFLGGDYTTTSSFTATIVGTSVTNLLNNPAGEWQVGESLLTFTGSWAAGTSGSYEIAVLTSTPSTLTVPIEIGSGSYAAVQSFNYQTSDVYMDVTNMVMGWIYGVIPNNGIILLHSNETSSYDFGKLRYFSKESNTIYQPHLDVMWSDVVLDPNGPDGPLALADVSKPSVVSVNLNKEYKQGSIVRINVLARPKYVTKTFTNRVSDYNEPMHLPEISYYSIKDAETEETVMAFDSYTQLSSDMYGNYFMLDTTGLPQERYYTVEVRSEISGSINTFTSPLTFKISR